MDRTALGHTFTSQMPESIKKQYQNADPKFLVATKDYKCILCEPSQIVKAWQFHYHNYDHSKAIPNKQGGKKRWIY